MNITIDENDYSYYFSYYFDDYQSFNKNEFNKTKIYDYHIKHPDNIKLTEFINKHITSINVNNLKFICNCYNYLIDQKLYDVTYEIIDGSNSIDEIAIFLVSIDLDEYNLLDLLISKKFNVNQKINCNKDFLPSTIDLLTYAVTSKKLEMCKYLVANGANPFLNNSISFCKSCNLDNDEIFNYFMEFDIPEEYLKEALHNCLLKLDFNKITQILNKNFDLNNLDQKFFDSIHSLDIQTLQFLLKNGLQLKSNILLGSACYNNNIKLIKFCLELGLRPNEAIIKNVIDNFNLSIIKLFTEYNIDLSFITNIIPNINEYDDIIEKFEYYGLSKNSLLNYLIYLRDDFKKNEYIPK